MGLWPIAFIVVCNDSSKLDLYDFALIGLLTALGTWGVVTRHSLARWLVAGIMLAVISFAYDLGPVLRAVIAHKDSASNEFVAGARAFYDALLPLRPYLFLAAFNLFAMAVTHCKDHGLNCTE